MYENPYISLSLLSKSLLLVMRIPLKCLFRQLNEENHNTKEEIKALEAKNTEIISMLCQSDQKIIKLESELSEKEIVLEEKNDLISENEDLRALTAQQHNHLKLCRQEIQDSREELNILETIISQLSLNTSEEVE